MILAIDVGNSNIVLGGIDNEKIYFTVRLSTDRFKSNDEYAVLIKNLIELNGYDPADMEGSIISTVVPALATTLRLALEKITGKPCMVVGSGLKTGLNILTIRRSSAATWWLTPWRPLRSIPSRS